MDLVPSINNTQVGGRICAYAGTFLPVHCTGIPAIWCRDMGPDPPYQEGTGGVSPPGLIADNGEATSKKN